MTNKFKGVIVINGYFKCDSYTHQVERLIECLENDNVEMSVYKNDKPTIVGDKFLWDFAVFLDKDMNLAQLLTNCNVRLFNSAESIKLADNKILTNIILDKNKISIPKTIPAPIRYVNGTDESYLKKTAEMLGFPIVIKEAYGSLGAQVYKADNYTDLKVISEKVACKEHCYQEYIKNSAGKSIRAILIGKKVICAMLLINDKDFRSNAHLGGRAMPYKLDTRQEQTAVSVAKIMDLDYCGIDFFYESDTVIEVNSNAYFMSIEKVCGMDIAKLYADYILKKMEN